MRSKEEHLVELEEDLAPWLPREKEMGRILSAAAEASMQFDQEIEAVEDGLNIREANTKEEIVKASQPIKIEPRDDETLDEFRKRTLKKYNSLTLDGSAQGMLETLSSLFGADKEKISIENVSGKPVFEARISADELNPEFGTINETLLQALELTSATYALDFFRKGSLDYISKEDRNNSNYNSSRGYGTVDSDGNITDDGTYSGYYFNSQ